MDRLYTWDWLCPQHQPEVDTGSVLDLSNPSDFTCVTGTCPRHALLPRLCSSLVSPGRRLRISLPTVTNAGISRPQVVQEKLVCHSTIGTQRGRSLVMTVTVICEFVAPLIQPSTKQLLYRLEKVSGAVRGRARRSGWGSFCSESKINGKLIPSQCFLSFRDQYAFISKFWI